MTLFNPVDEAARDSATSLQSDVSHHRSIGRESLGQLVGRGDASGEGGLCGSKGGPPSGSVDL